jgi:Cu/Ag efflux protein CusF
MKRLLAALAVVVATAAVARAQKPVTQTDGIEATAKIEAIDHSLRLITLKDKDGATETIYAGPDVKRFDELKVGDTVTFRYYESVAYVIRKPGQPGAAPVDQAAKITRGTGPKPGGTIAKQETATVTIKAIDAKTPAVTVLTQDGRTASFKVDDKKNLTGVAVGDKVEITFTTAVMISVK